MNDNLLGRILALALLLSAAYGVQSIARGGLSCPLGHGSYCAMPLADLAPAAPAKAKAVETDEDANLQKKAPVVPPAESGDQDGD